VLGNHFTVPELEALQSMLEREPLADDAQLDAGVGVQRLVEGGLLLRHRAGRLSFRHALLRDTIYQLLPEAQRARLHRAAFEAYRSLELPVELRLPRLARHAAQCGERAVAADTYLSLARSYARVQTYLEAEAAFSHALDNLDASDARSIEAARGRGLMRSRLGRQEGALADVRQARERAHALGDLQQELELMLDEATVLDWTREGNQSRALAEQVSAAQAALSPLLAARLAMSLARSHHRRAEVEASVRLGQQAVQLAEALGDEAYETRVIALLMLATDYANSSRLPEAQRAFEQVIAEASSRGDIWHVAAAHCNRAALWHGLRDVTQLRSDLARTVQLSREIGEASLEWVATYNLAESQYVLGQLAEARERAQRAFALSKQLFGEGNREVSVCELLLARIALYEEDLPAAGRHVQAIRERAQRALAAGEQDAELEPGQAIMLEMLDLGTRGAGLPEWQALLSRTRSFQLQPMEDVELLERASLCALQAGEYEAGRALFERARAISAQKPNLISERVEARLGPLFAPAA
jgi:tetratricopeptide (TPR) repeat protein